MFKKVIAFGFLFGLIGFALFGGGCGQTSTPSSSATTTTVAASSAVAISGTTAVGVTTLGLRTFADALGSAEVKIGYCEAGSDEVKELGRGTTAPDGTYEVRVPVASLEALKATGGYVPNLMVEISKEGVVIGCVIPSLSPEAGSRGYAPTASKGDYKKALIARAAFKKGKNPKDFDYSGSVDRKFSSESMKDYSPGMIDDMGDSIMSGEEAEAGIGTALGISDTNMALLRQKGFELGRTYIEPIMRAAFESKTPPDRAAMDRAFASMEAEMSTYARDILGLSDQQITDLKSMKDKAIETEMGEHSDLAGDDSFREAKLRMSGDKMVNMFLGQWNAADTIAQLAPSGKQSFKDNPASAAVYTSFAASRESIKTELLSLMSTPGTSPEAIPTYMRTAFFDAFLFPPMAAKPEIKEGFDPASMEAMFASYTNNRIMVYFMQTFLTELQRMTYFSSQESAMQPIFTNRFQNTASPYYMGPNFWSGNFPGGTPGTPPTPQQINDRLVLYNAALDAAMTNNTALRTIFIAAGFTDAQATSILNAFRILMAPPDAF